MPNYEYDGSQDPEFIASLEAEQADSERIGAEIIADGEAQFAGKFNSAEELERGYIELQKLLGSKGDSTSEPEDESVEETETVDDAEDEDEIDVATYLANEFAENGELSAETLEYLSQFDAGEVAALLLAAQPASETQGSAALSEADQQQLQGIVGTPEEYGQMVEWAKANVQQAEIDAFNAVVSSSNPEAIYFAIQALNSRYKAEAGYEGRLIDRTRPPVGRGDVFRSQAEVARAMNDPRYDSDAAYRNDVYEKLERSTDLDYT